MKYMVVTPEQAAEFYCFGTIPSGPSFHDRNSAMIVWANRADRCCIIEVRS